MIVFDTETTGLPLPEHAPLSSQPKIIEIACIKLDFNLKEVERFDALVNPEMPIPKAASAVNNISDEDVKDKPPFAGIYNDLCNFFLGEKTIFAHNCPFDMNMLKFELNRANVHSRIKSSSFTIRRRTSFIKINGFISSCL